MLSLEKTLSKISQSAHVYTMVLYPNQVPELKLGELPFQTESKLSLVWLSTRKIIWIFSYCMK